MALGTYLKAATLALAFVATCGAGQAAVIHSDGATNPGGQYRGIGALQVDFASTGGSGALSFDLFGARSVDGFGNGWDDLFTVSVNGAAVFAGYFSMSGGGSNLVTLNTLGWSWSTVKNPGGSFSGGVTSVSGVVNLLAGQNSFKVAFAAVGRNNGGNQGTGDESWALNALSVATPPQAPAPVPLPAALPLLGAAMAGLGLVGMRRRKDRAR